MWRDLERICAAHGIAWRKPTHFPRNGLLAARVALAADGEAWQPELVRALYLANFAEDREIGDREIVAEVLQSLGREAEHWLARAVEPETKQGLRDQTDRARSLGIFGAPSFTVAGELYWGHDRIEEALDHAVRAAPA
jgi:2-hydroxychromene-2-carboxylate isomerase